MEYSRQDGSSRFESYNTPMWQYPAVEGSYPPTIYKGMNESYSHYMSEGYSQPWYQVHSAESLKRPGLPMMACFDNGFGLEGGDRYEKDAMIVAARGMQGAGIEHFSPLGTSNKNDPKGASAYLTTNTLLKMYGSIFAEVPPANEGAVLYSYHTDITQSRNAQGTPQWERVNGLYTAGLMAGVPMNIVCEEDLANGWLLLNGKPRVPMLFLPGLGIDARKPKKGETLPSADLPQNAKDAIVKFQQAGGRFSWIPMARTFPAQLA